MSGRPVIRARYRPRTARGPSLAAVYLVVPLALVAILAARVRGSLLAAVQRRPRPVAPTAAFVRLTPEQSVAAMARVRTAWQLERGGPVSVDFDPADAAFALAAKPAAPVSVRRPRLRPPAYSATPAGVPERHPLAPPSLAAPAPEELPADYAPLAAAELFTRAELLRFDGLEPLKKGKKR